MLTVFVTFIIAFVLSLVLTPAAGWMGNRFGAVDVPLARNVHTKPIPRSGGLAIALSFLLALVAVSYLPCPTSEHLSMDSRRAFTLLGGFVIFCVGFFDDFHRLRPRVKLLGQILAASMAYYGGLRIDSFAFGGTAIYFGILSYLITVFWFLLLINAMNLIDGLDGLAAGIAFFACVVMVFMSSRYPDYLIALEFAAVAGALLGFLRYNFNPASIFMGDGGSYFIGYTIAALSILGSIKSQLGAALLIPLLALGVPIFDTMLSPVRRWLLGREMFQPDKGHIHHHLIEKGLSSRMAVFVIYGISFVLCIAAIILVNMRNAFTGIALTVLILVFFIVVRKLGYLEYVAIDKIYGWIRDMSDTAGLTQGRRSFLNIQIEIERAQNTEELWESICQALEMMRFDRGELYIYYSTDKDLSEPAYVTTAHYEGMERRGETVNWYNDENIIGTVTEGNRSGIVRVWTRGYTRRRDDVSNKGLFRIEFPLGSGNFAASRLVIMKDVSKNPIPPYTMRRAEYLRRSITTAMKNMGERLEPVKSERGIKEKTDLSN